MRLLLVSTKCVKMEESANVCVCCVQMRGCVKERELKGSGVVQLLFGFLCGDGSRLVVGINEDVGLLPIGLFPCGGASVSIATSYAMIENDWMEYQAHWRY